MPTANEKILNAFVKRQVYLFQFSDYVSTEAIKNLRATEKEIRKLVLYYADLLSEPPPSNAREYRAQVTRRRKQIEESFVRDLIKVRGPAWKKISGDVRKEMVGLIEDQVRFVSQVIIAAVPAQISLDLPTKDDQKFAVENKTLQGRLLQEWIRGAEEIDRRRITDALQVGVDSGESPSETVRRVMGTALVDYTDGVVRRAWTDTEALVSTATVGTADEGRTLLSQRNEFIIRQEYFVATLDGNTTPICIDSDGNIYEVGKGRHPPLHFRCRSIRVPYITDDALSTRAFDPSTERTLVREYADRNNLTGIRTRNDLPRGTKGDFDKFARARRRELIGQVPDKVTYPEWLSTQSPDFIDEVLGVTRGKAFREGRIKIGKFVNRRGRLLTLAELRKKGYDI